MTETQAGRPQQRARTERDIVAAARRLMESGEVPTVASAAKAAGVARATAYRYFSSREELLASVMRDQMQVVRRVPGRAGDDAADRVVSVIRADYRLRRRFETQSRVWLGLVTGPDSANLERGWRVPPLETAVDALPEGEDKVRLLQALSLLVGPEPFVILRDVWQLDDDAAAEVLAWAGRVLVEATTGSTGTT